MRRAIRITGAAACLLAVSFTVVGHWAVLQSVAWARMFANFSRTESISSALEKTFDGRHPCAMCLKIREGRAQEKKPPPLLKWEKLPEFVLQSKRMVIPVPPTITEEVVPLLSALHADFIPAPPKPPPRPV